MTAGSIADDRAIAMRCRRASRPRRTHSMMLLLDAFLLHHRVLLHDKADRRDAAALAQQAAHLRGEARVANDEEQPAARVLAQRAGRRQRMRMRSPAART